MKGEMSSCRASNTIGYVSRNRNLGPAADVSAKDDSNLTKHSSIHLGIKSPGQEAIKTLPTTTCSEYGLSLMSHSCAASAAWRPARTAKRAVWVKMIQILQKYFLDQ